MYVKETGFLNVMYNRMYLCLCLCFRLYLLVYCSVYLTYVVKYVCQGDRIFHFTTKCVCVCVCVYVYVCLLTFSQLSHTGRRNSATRSGCNTANPLQHQGRGQHSGTIHLYPPSPHQPPPGCRAGSSGHQKQLRDSSASDLPTAPVQVVLDKGVYLGGGLVCMGLPGQS